MLELENPFWRFSLTVYGGPGVAKECLDLQEKHHIDVNMLLFCAWMGFVRRVALDKDEISVSQRTVSDWQLRAVRPLRIARQSMTALPGAEELRSLVKALELQAECIEQAMLFAVAAQRWPERNGADPSIALHSNLSAFLGNCGVSGTDDIPLLLRTVESSQA